MTVVVKRGSTRLRFSLLLKFYAQHGWFPLGRGELSDEAMISSALVGSDPGRVFVALLQSGRIVGHDTLPGRSTQEGGKVAVELATFLADVQHPSHATPVLSR